MTQDYAMMGYQNSDDDTEQVGDGAQRQYNSGDMDILRYGLIATGGGGTALLLYNAHKNAESGGGSNHNWKISAALIASFVALYMSMRGGMPVIKSDALNEKKRDSNGNGIGSLGTESSFSTRA